jgi:ligand-binding SRPBCC domain-containing protein
MTVTFERVTVIDAPTEVVFDLSLNIDAHVASMGASGERAVAGVTSGQIGVGEEVTWSARHLGRRWRMTSKVAELDRPTRFVDCQTRGPFARFRHEHRFEALPGGRTRMVDDISFDAPFGPVGRLAERMVLGRYLPQLIEERNRYLKAEAELHR